MHIAVHKAQPKMYANRSGKMCRGNKLRKHNVSLRVLCSSFKSGVLGNALSSIRKD